MLINFNRETDTSRKMTEALFQDIRDALDMNSIVSVADVSGKITYANNRFCEISKYTLEELIGKDHRLLNSGYHSKAFWQNVWKTISSGKSWSGEVCNKAKDGSIYWVQSDIVPIFSKDGKIKNYISIRKVITKQKELEQIVESITAKIKTKSGQGFFETLVQNLSSALKCDAAFLGKLQTDGKSVNTLAFIVNGELQKNLFFSLKDTPAELALAKRSACTYLDDVQKLFPKAKHLSDIEARGYVVYPIFSDEGYPTGVLNVSYKGRILDEEKVTRILNLFSSRIAKEISLQRISSELANAFVDSPIALVRLSSEGRIQKVNSAFVKLSERDTLEMIGKKFEDYTTGLIGCFSGTDGLGEITEVVKVRSTFEGRIKRKSGEELPVVFTVGSAIDFDKTVNGWMVYVQDLSELKRKEAIISDHEIKMIASSRLSELGELAGTIAHEINNPLTVIITKAGRIREELQNDPLLSKVEPQLSKIEEMCKRVTKMIQAIRKSARDGSKDPFEYCKLKSLMEDTAELCRDKLNRTGVSLKLGQIPDISVECRSVELTQVMTNLVNNACDAIQNLEERWVQIDCEYINDKVKINFTDSGKGIPKEIADKLMQAFFTTKPAGHGTGLGLRISQGIVSSHNGRLYLDREYKNTRFVIELPLSQPKTLQEDVKAAA